MRKEQLKSIALHMDMKPMLSLSDKDLKEIKDWEVGKEYKVELTIKQTGKHERDGKFSGEFEVMKIKKQ